MSAQHIAGLPIEEILLAAGAALAPMIALIGWEIRDHLKRIRRALRPPTSPETLPEPSSE